jgi:hypothetical protein
MKKIEEYSVDGIDSRHRILEENSCLGKSYIITSEKYGFVRRIDGLKNARSEVADSVLHEIDFKIREYKAQIERLEKSQKMLSESNRDISQFLIQE